MDLNDLTYKIRGAIFKVHSSLGPGLLESVYEAALAYELMLIGLTVLTQVGVPVNYNDVKLELGFRLDILVDDKVIVEVKSVEVISSESFPSDVVTNTFASPATQQNHSRFTL